MNSEFAIENAESAARRATALAGDGKGEAEALIRATYRLILSREPAAEEVELAHGHLARQEDLFELANFSREEALQKAVENLAHMLISSNEFLYIP